MVEIYERFWFSTKQDSYGRVISHLSDGLYHLKYLGYVGGTSFQLQDIKEAKQSLKDNTEVHFYKTMKVGQCYIINIIDGKVKDVLYNTTIKTPHKNHIEKYKLCSQ